MKIVATSIIVLVLTITQMSAQGIGKMADEKPLIDFPNNSLGLDLMFSEGGFGLGGFYRREFTENLTGFIDFSFSETKDDKEFEYVDYWGNTYIAGKKNRIILLPLNFGVQYRVFRETIAENLRPYLNFGVGPTLTVTTPYKYEYFEAFGYAKAKVALGGYIGIGANFGVDKSSLYGINVRYYFIHYFDEGVESLENSFKKNVGGIYITLNIGLMY